MKKFLVEIMVYADNSFWEKYKNDIPIDSEQSLDLEKKFSQYSALIEENQNIYAILKSILKDIPIGVALRYGPIHRHR